MFAGFVVAALLFGRRRREPTADSARRRAVGVFVAYVLAASFGAGLFQKNLWPFCDWPLIAGIVPDTIQELHVVGVDARGVEHEIDYRAWEPMAFREMGAWLSRVFVRLDSATQDSAAAFLLRTAESARRHARAGGGVGYLDRYLGPVAAPYFLLHPRRWDDPAAVPDAPFTALRLYWVSWNVVARAGGSAAFTRRDVYRFPRL